MRIALVVADSLRADAAGFGGGSFNTPFMDKIASEGAVFSNALSCAPWTVPSFGALVTGVYAHRLGLYRWDQPIPVQYDTLFSVLADNDYRVASFVFDPDHLFCSMPEARVVGSSQQMDRVFDWIAQCPDPNLFVLVHYWGTHFPYIDQPMTVPAWKAVTDKILDIWRRDPETVRMKVQGLYRRATERFSERFLPLLLEAICRHRGQGGSSVVVTADHGESWGERLDTGPLDVFDMHGNHLRNEVLRVPLLVWNSEVQRRCEIRHTVRNVDLAPTLAEFAGIANPWPTQGPAAPDGVSMAALLDGDQPDRERLSVACASRDFVTSNRPPPRVPSELWTLFSLQCGSWKLIWKPDTGERWVYNLLQDPTEQSPGVVGSGEPEEAWHELEREVGKASCAPAPDPTENRLRSLGYLE